MQNVKYALIIVARFINPAFVIDDIDQSAIEGGGPSKSKLIFEIINVIYAPKILHFYTSKYINIKFKLFYDIFCASKLDYRKELTFFDVKLLRPNSGSVDVPFLIQGNIHLRGEIF